jgi:hypothetical protein
MKDFQPKDRVHWTLNGESIPGTVIRRTKTRVYVRRDSYDFQQSTFDHDQSCLNPFANPSDYCIVKGDLDGPVLCFTLRSNEQWVMQGHKVPMSGNRLKIGWKACPKPQRQ